MFPHKLPFAFQNVVYATLLVFKGTSFTAIGYMLFFFSQGTLKKKTKQKKNRKAKGTILITTRIRMFFSSGLKQNGDAFPRYTVDGVAWMQEARQGSRRCFPRGEKGGWGVDGSVDVSFACHSNFICKPLDKQGESLIVVLESLPVGDTLRLIFRSPAFFAPVLVRPSRFCMWQPAWHLLRLCARH